MTAAEVNFDGLVGPTHNYAGLSYGNVASISHGLTVSNPRAAVLQGLEKMKLLSDLGIEQAVLPPHERPDLRALRNLGFRGTDARILEDAGRQAPHILAACCSSSSMWAANAATVSPSADTADGKVHFTAANLINFFHRALEAQFTARVLQTIFPDEAAFVHHPPLPAAAQFSDEGAANHTRLCSDYGEAGVELFVYGRRGFGQEQGECRLFPPRQTLEASATVARLHGLNRDNTVYFQQNPHVIDTGVFHNDVISVGNQHVFLYHSQAFCEPERGLNELGPAMKKCAGVEPIFIEVTPDRITVEEAVRSYLFNSQLITLPGGAMCLVSPAECGEDSRIAAFLDELVAQDNPITQVKIVDIRQSMKNGGGPACLRLRVVLTPEEQALAHQGVFLTDELYRTLVDWAQRHYREEIHPQDLVDPSLVDESRAALDELTQILGLGSIYDFQRQP